MQAAGKLAAQLREAMVSRATIEQAKGVLISRLGVTESVAFDYLVKLSQNSHRKLRDIAATAWPRASQGPGSEILG